MTSMREETTLSSFQGARDKFPHQIIAKTSRDQQPITGHRPDCSAQPIKLAILGSSLNNSEIQKVVNYIQALVLIVKASKIRAPMKVFPL
jgi:hypothetical protein